MVVVVTIAAVVVVVVVEVVVGAGNSSLSETAPVLLSPAPRAQPRGRVMDILGMSARKPSMHYLASSLLALVSRPLSYYNRAASKSCKPRTVRDEGGFTFPPLTVIDPSIVANAKQRALEPVPSRSFVRSFARSYDLRGRNRRPFAHPPCFTSRCTRCRFTRGLAPL